MPVDRLIAAIDPAPIVALAGDLAEMPRPEDWPSNVRTLVDLGAPGATAMPREIRRSEDGLFYIVGRVNGVNVRFLVDTGASIVVLTRSDASRVGALPPVSAFQETASTAAGATPMARVKLSRIETGASQGRNVEAAVSSGGLQVSLLGQNWLSQLGSLTISGDRMVIQ